MMRSMLDLLKEQGYEKASLAIQKSNYAVRLYEKVGFRKVNENSEDSLEPTLFLPGVIFLLLRILVSFLSALLNRGYARLILDTFAVFV